MTSATPTLDVARFIDELPIGRFHVRIAALCAAIVFMDGFDAQAIGYVAPSISKAWSLHAGALGPVFGAGLFGIMLGALVGGPLADRIGRKKVILFAALFFGLCSLLTALADGLPALMVLRFLTGLGLGAAMPNAIALTAEYSAYRNRSTMIMVMFCGFSLGAAIGGVLAAYLIPSWGWPAVFVFGGLMPLVLVPMLLAALPESARFLVLAGGGGSQVAPILSRLSGREIDPATRFVLVEEHPRGFLVAHLFKHGRAGSTLLLWIIFFMSLLDLYFLASWLPTVIHDRGVPVERAVIASSLFQVGGTLAALLLGRVIDRFGPYRTLFTTYLLAGGFIVMIGRTGPALAPLMFAIFATGFCVVGAQGGANALAATLYPTLMRSTGVGWALGIGRVGSIVGPVIGGMLLSMRWPSGQLFLLAAIPMICAAAAAAALSSVVTRNRDAGGAVVT